MLRPDPPAIAAVLRRPAVFWSLTILAVALRVACTAWPAHFDQHSWELVSDLVLDGRNVYASTELYNYGPAWMGILGALKWLASDAHFRLAVCLFLSCVDVAIAAVLRTRGLVLPAVLFLFSPWTVLVTGHQHMFDDAMILLGLLAVLWVESRPGVRDGKQTLSTLSLRDTLVGAALLGCSLVMKHVLWLFPLWMAFKTRDWVRRAIWLGVPVGIFVLSFLPFWTTGKEGIFAHVRHYSGAENAPFFYLFAPNGIDLFFGDGPHLKLTRVLYGVSLIAAGAVLRRHRLLEWYVAYLVFVVLLSAAVWNHYFVIPVLFTLLYRNVWGWLYNLLALPYYVCSHTSLNKLGSLPTALQPAGKFLDEFGVYIFMIILLLCYLQAFWSHRIRAAWQWTSNHVAGSLRGHE